MQTHSKRILHLGSRLCKAHPPMGSQVSASNELAAALLFLSALPVPTGVMVASEGPGHPGGDLST